MVDDIRLDEDGRALDLHPRVRIRTPGLLGRARVHEARSEGMRGAEDTRESFLEAMRRNEVAEDLTVEILDARERTPSPGGRGSEETDMQLEVRDPGEAFGQVVLYESEDGALSWHFPQQGPPDQRVSRGSDVLSYRIPRQVARNEEADSGQRGVLGAVGKKVLKVLTFRLVKEGSRWLGARFAERVESSRRPYALRSFAPGDHRRPVEHQLNDDELRMFAEGRALLFVHGTFSTSHGGFGRLPDDVLGTLHRAYGGRVLAFEHPTVSVDPPANVAWLADRLGAAGVRLDLDVVAHSRGGLVGRVMTERGGLGSVADVGRLVMVGTPNAGTVLADEERLDQILDRFTTLLQLVPDNGLTDALDILLAVVKQVAAGVMSGLDGITAMKPTGPFLTEQLNLGHTTAASYFAAAADYEPPQGSPFLRVARDGAIDVVFGRTDNDLVVPTAGVFDVPGAGAFPVGERLVFDASLGVDHSGFWAQQDFTSRLMEWLPGTR